VKDLNSFRKAVAVIEVLFYENPLLNTPWFATGSFTHWTASIWPGGGLQYF